MADDMQTRRAATKCHSHNKRWSALWYLNLHDMAKNRENNQNDYLRHESSQQEVAQDLAACQVIPTRN